MFELFLARGLADGVIERFRRSFIALENSLSTSSSCATPRSLASMTRLPCLISRATSKATPAWSGLGEIAHVIKMLRTISNRGKRLKVASTPPLAQAEYIGEPSRLPMPPAVDPSPSVTR